MLSYQAEIVSTRCGHRLFNEIMAHYTLRLRGNILHIIVAFRTSHSIFKRTGFEDSTAVIKRQCQQLVFESLKPSQAQYGLMWVLNRNHRLVVSIGP